MKRNSRRKGIFIILLLLFILSATFYFFSSMSAKGQAKEAVNQFYSYEQNGAFSDSWAMFHPMMQEKFPKAAYLDDRAHVFMHHFDVTTFTFSLDYVSKIKDWQMEADTEPIDLVYQVTVSQEFKEGKYGNFTIVQEVYVTELDGEWRVLWDYNS